MGEYADAMLEAAEDKALGFGRDTGTFDIFECLPKERIATQDELFELAGFALQCFQGTQPKALDECPEIVKEAYEHWRIMHGWAFTIPKTDSRSFDEFYFDKFCEVACQ